VSAFDRYVGIPYLDRGRSLVGLDCYGLLVLVYRELRGIELPCFAEAYVTAADRQEIRRLIAGGLSAWRQIAAGKEAAFDGVLMREGAQPTHIGIVVRPGLLLHVDRGETSRIERYLAPPLVHRVVGFYRYSALEPDSCGASSAARANSAD
jgi:cell wall-associated NlpC family hydrolase